MYSIRHYCQRRGSSRTPASPAKVCHGSSLTCYCTVASSLPAAYWVASQCPQHSPHRQGYRTRPPLHLLLSENEFCQLWPLAPWLGLCVKENKKEGIKIHATETHSVRVVVGWLVAEFSPGQHLAQLSAATHWKVKQRKILIRYNSTSQEISLVEFVGLNDLNNRLSCE